MNPWVQTYIPKEQQDIKGQDLAVRLLRDFVTNYKKQKKKAALLYGPSGVGKTSSVYVLAKELDLEVMEVNASDFRNNEQITLLVGSAGAQQSLFSKGKIILVDEMDGLSGQEDRGGVSAIVEQIKKSSFPMVLTASNPWDNKFSSIRSNTLMIEYKSLDYLTIYEILKGICKIEHIEYDEMSLKGLARRAGGDARAAINDLQALVLESKKLTKESLDELSPRDQTETMLNALTQIFKTTDPAIAVKAFDTIQEDQDACFLWLDENIPKEYERPQDLARAYDALSRADVFKGRIRRWQHWRFMVYINALYSAGISVAKDQKYSKFTKYSPTRRILKLWWAKQKSAKKKAVAKKLARATHTSARKALQSMLPYFQLMFKKNKEFAGKMTEQLKLDDDEVAWLRK
jgi:replication factor C large subunit